MIGLFRSEVLRLTSRRLARIGALAFLGILLLIQIVAAGRSHDPTDVDRARMASVQQDIDQSRQFCEDAKTSGGLPPSTDCAAQAGDLESYGDYDPRYEAADVVPAMASGIAVAAALLGFFVGASYIGADWATGSLQALLFWEPRRGRVVLAKAAALVTVLAAFTLAAEAFGWLTTMLVAVTRGTTEGATGGMHVAAFLTMLRGAFVVSFTGLLGFAFAGLARVTAAALGVALVNFVILENLVRAYRPGWVPYIITTNVDAVLTKRADLTDLGGAPVVVGGIQGAATLALYLALFVGAFYAAFSQRDVT